MFFLISTLYIAITGALAVVLPAEKRASCSTATGTVTVINAASGIFLGYLSATLQEGQVVLTQNVNSAMEASLECGAGPYGTVVYNANPDTYGYFTGVALYNSTLAAGSPNWAFLSTSSLGATVPNAFTDATGVPVVTLRQGIFRATTTGVIDLGLLWGDWDVNGVAQQQVPAYGFARSDGNLVGITGDIALFLGAMQAEDQSYTAVNFQMVATA